jgi:hypothetical protein
LRDDHRVDDQRDERTGRIVHVHTPARRRRPALLSRSPEAVVDSRHPHGYDRRHRNPAHDGNRARARAAQEVADGAPPRLPWSLRRTLAPLWRVMSGLGPRWWGVVDDYRVVPWADGADPKGWARTNMYGWQVVDEDWVRLVDARDERHVGWLRLPESDARKVIAAGVVAVYGGPARVQRRRGVVTGPFGTIRVWIFPRTQRWYVG